MVEALLRCGIERFVRRVLLWAPCLARAGRGRQDGEEEDDFSCHGWHDWIATRKSGGGSVSGGRSSGLRRDGGPASSDRSRRAAPPDDDLRPRSKLGPHP